MLTPPSKHQDPKTPRSRADLAPCWVLCHLRLSQASATQVTAIRGLGTLGMAIPSRNISVPRVCPGIRHRQTAGTLREQPLTPAEGHCCKPQNHSSSTAASPNSADPSRRQANLESVCLFVRSRTRAEKPRPAPAQPGSKTRTLLQQNRQGSKEGRLKWRPHPAHEGRRLCCRPTMLAAVSD